MSPLYMQTKHFQLSPADRLYLMTLTTKGQLPARVFKRATALLELHRGQTLRAISKSLQSSYQSIANWRDNYRSAGLQSLQDKPRSGRPIVIDGKERASITALACSTPPQGHARWTLRMLADRAVELGHCDSLSHTQARRILKKTNFSRT